MSRIVPIELFLALAVGCDGAKETAESIGMIGGEDGPTAVWLTTRLPGSNGEPVILRGTKGTGNCVFDDNGAVVPNASKRQNQEPKAKLQKWTERR